MEKILTIELKQLRFFGFHGLFPEERKTGNEFEVNLSVTFYPGNKEVITRLKNTIDYGVLYNMVKSEMDTPTKLLETLVMKMAGQIHAAFPFIKKIDVSVAKLHPPIIGFSGNVAVRFSKEYEG